MATHRSIAVVLTGVRRPGSRHVHSQPLVHRREHTHRRLGGGRVDACSPNVRNGRAERARCRTVALRPRRGRVRLGTPALVRGMIIQGAASAQFRWDAMRMLPSPLSVLRACSCADPLNVTSSPLHGLVITKSTG
jgi:hypothetical protein